MPRSGAVAALSADDRWEHPGQEARAKRRPRGGGSAALAECRREGSDGQLQQQQPGTPLSGVCPPPPAPPALPPRPQGPRKLLLVDNFDSYTYNLYQYIAVVCGTPPEVIKNSDPAGADRAFLSNFAGVVISPGPGRPECAADVGVLPDLCSAFGGPVLGVCLGFQAMGHWEGVPVVQAPTVVHGEVSAVHHGGGDPILDGIPTPFRAVRYHSLMLHPGALSQSSSLELLGATVEPPGSSGPTHPCPVPHWLPAREADAVVPMVLRHRTLPHWGVQYHPESVCSEHGLQLVANFAAICGAARGGWRHPQPLPRPLPAPAPAAAAGRVLWALRWAPPQGCATPIAELSLGAFTAAFGSSPDAVWLDSCGDTRGRWSMATDAQHPGAFRVAYTVGGDVEVSGPGAARFDHLLPGEPVLDRMSAFLAEEQAAGVTVAPVGLPPGCPAPELPFQGGFMGFIGYEVRQDCLLAAHGPAAAAECDLGPPETASGLPDLHFVWAERFLAVDHHSGCMWVCCCEPQGSASAPPQWAHSVLEALAALPPAAAAAAAAPPPPPERPAPQPLRFVPSQCKAQYISAITEAQREIMSGETYEVCLTNEFELACAPPADPLAFYAGLRVANPAPYGAFIRVPGHGAVCSTSPERFLRVGAGGEVEARPIKGTIRRDLTDPAEDERLRQQLISSKKDQCENLMIVDLLRNDLGMLCVPGTVCVPPGKLMDIESFRTVHQMVTTVQGVLPRDGPRAAPARGAVDLVRVTFPGGSITGAPKMRTTKIIQRLEQRRRGLYTGSIGYFCRSGAADLSIVIRTAVIAAGPKGPRLRVGAGGAITALSDPEEEWEEIMVKARPLLGAVSRAINGEGAGWELYGAGSDEDGQQP
eukprot:TRINITY_DN9892_c1_g5_i1.p1 TRINITY_DN9892_c1_g5~~TRINITY_DN9892_c1_g5_i1.p1  ORF type:complete len:898 (+),score=198.65 TRINITY_DN9892_c1_g5_i1:77-2695(+)